MRTALNITRILVGLLFIFSGLVKANDPLGLSYKMQEFFELWGMTGFNTWTLAMSVCMNALEIIAGVALIIGWQIRFFSWLLLVLIVFFTFLTGYAYLSGKFTNCGCFGDCLPISPLTSFLKDVALLALIGFIFIKRDLIRPFFSNRANIVIMTLATLFAFGLQWYTLARLPIVDCLPFKEGNNIPEKMRIPAGAQPDSFAIRFVYKKGDQNYEFDATNLPADLDTYTFVERIDKLVRKGNAVAPIKGFNLTGLSKTDSTEAILSQPLAFLLFCEDFSTPIKKWSEDFNEIYQEAKKKNVPIWLVTTRPDDALREIKGTPIASIPIMTCDFTAVRTAARTNPCLYMLQAGTVSGKYSRWDFDEALRLFRNITK